MDSSCGTYFTDAEAGLLSIAANTDDTSDEWLSEITPYSRATIRSMFGQIGHKMSVRNRGCAVVEALRDIDRGWSRRTDVPPLSRWSD